MNDEEIGGGIKGYRVFAYLYDLENWLLTLPAGGQQSFQKEFIDLVDPEPGNSILELCCGTGNITQMLAKRVGEGAKITASDISPDQLRIAKWKANKNNLDIDYSLQDASKTSYPPAAFDKVVISGAFHEMESETRKAVFTEVIRLLKPGGSFIVSEFNRPRHWLGSVFFRLHNNPLNQERHIISQLVDGGLESELSQAGFTVEEERLAMFEVAHFLRCSVAA